MVRIRFASLIALLGLLGACSADNTEAGDKIGTEAVAYYGTNVLSQWDPTKSASPPNDVPYFTQVYDRLLQLQSDLSVGPALATSHEFSADGRTLKMGLRDDVVFHDGSAFDADNAVTNLNRNRATGSILAPSLSNITDVAATGPYELEITLETDDPLILYTLASTSSSMVSPTGLANEASLATAPAGSGPFKFVKYDGTTVRLERNTDYWDRSLSLPQRKSISAVVDDAARLNAISSGTADIGTVRATQWSEVERLLTSGEVEAHQFSEMGQYTVYLNTSSGPLSDLTVRRAISMAIDRETINDALLSGLCAPSSQLVPEGFAGHADDLPAAHDFDVAGAKELLAAAGIKPFTVTALVADGGLFAQLGAVVKDQLAAIGITVELRPTPLSQLRAQWRAGKVDMMVLQTTPSTPDMMSLIDSDYLGPDGVEASMPEIEKLAAVARPLDIGSSERDEALRDISEALYEEPVHVQICQLPGIYLYRPGLQGVDMMPGSRLVANVPDTRTLHFGVDD